ncbi:Uncharacterised protein [Mycobacteroides abscessus subsp. abscessus]|nr:Uncharacterised protein [Mycobacteroides abscessus subsp. abscessus]
MIPTRTDPRFTGVAGVGIGSAIGSASTSPRINVILSSPGAVLVMVIRSARHAAASASACLCQSATD